MAERLGSPLETTLTVGHAVAGGGAYALLPMFAKDVLRAFRAMATASTPLVQRETPYAMRGRVSAIYSTFIGASNQLSEFRAGAVAAWLRRPAARADAEVASRFFTSKAMAFRLTGARF